MIARIVASIMTGKLLKDKQKDTKKGVFKKDRKKKDPTGVDAPPERKFSEVLTDFNEKF